MSPVIGAEVSGLDLSVAMDDCTLGLLRDALSEHLVLFFRNQKLTDEQHKAIGKRFGNMHVHPAGPKDEEHLEILVVHGDAKVKFVAGRMWHSDVSCDVNRRWTASYGLFKSRLLVATLCLPVCMPRSMVFRSRCSDWYLA
tara:strand:- start:8464 stop:8886 length:423 start_codon:yes stop_codon:yes gene_type:complete